MRLAPSGSDRTWNCDEISYSGGGMYCTFRPGKVSAGQPSKLKKYVELLDYTVKVTTSDSRGAGTDGRVFVTFTGDGGKTDEVRVEGGGEVTVTVTMTMTMMMMTM